MFVLEGLMLIGTSRERSTKGSVATFSRTENFAGRPFWTEHPQPSLEACKLSVILSFIDINTVRLCCRQEVENKSSKSGR